MPEGPEIRREADSIGEVLNAQPCNEIMFGLPALAHYQTQFLGQQIEKVTSRGKAMLIYFDNDWVIYSHNQLYGRWRVTRDHTRPATNRQLRLAIDTPKGSALLYSASDISVWHKSEIHQHPLIRRLGPDILNDETSESVLLSQLNDSQFQARQLSSLLLSQQFIAGLGNYLRAEILFFSGLMASRKLSSLTPLEKAYLAKQLKQISLRSYHTKGITLPPDLLAEQKKQYTKFEDYRFAVFDRAGEPCVLCRTTIVRKEMGGRRWYFCPSCQV